MAWTESKVHYLLLEHKVHEIKLTKLEHVHESLLEGSKVVDKDKDNKG